MDKIIRPIYMLPRRDPSQIERHTQTKVKVFHENGNEKKKTEVANIIPDKIDFTEAV